MVFVRGHCDILLSLGLWSLWEVNVSFSSDWVCGLCVRSLCNQAVAVCLVFVDGHCAIPL